MTSPFQPKSVQVPGLLTDDAFQEQLKQFAADKNAQQNAAPPPNSAVDFADRIGNEFLKPGALPGMVKSPSLQKQDRAIDVRSDILSDVLPEADTPGTTLLRSVLGPIGIFGEGGLADKFLFDPQQRQEAAEERLQEAQRQEQAVKTHADARAKLRGLTDEEAAKMGLPVAPGGTSADDMRDAETRDTAVVKTAEENTAEKKKAVSTPELQPTMPWWLNVVREGYKSTAGMPLGTAKGGIALWELGPGRFLNGGDLERSNMRAWVDTVEQTLDKMMPGDKARSKDFVTQLAQGGGSMMGFMIGGFVGKAIGLPAGSVPAIMGALTSGSEGLEDAERYNAVGVYKYIAFFANAALGVTEAIPIDRMFMTAEQATGGLVSRMLANTLASGLEEFIQEFGQAVGQDNVAKWTYDAKRELDAAKWATQGVIGFLTGGLGGASVQVLNEAGVVGQPPETPIDDAAREEAAQTVMDMLQDRFDQSVTEDRPDIALSAEEAADAILKGETVPEGFVRVNEDGTFTEAGGETFEAGQQPEPATDAVLDSYAGVTNARELNLEHNGSTLQADISDQAIQIRELFTPEETRGQGNARALMEQLLSRADAEGKPVELLALAEDDATNDEQLVAFYESLGFERQYDDPNGGVFMRRSPRGTALAFKGEGGTIPVNENGKLELRHYSHEVLTDIDPAMRGTGPLRGKERDRLGPPGSSDPNVVDRAYFGTGTPPTAADVNEFKRELQRIDRMKAKSVRDPETGTWFHPKKAAYDAVRRRLIDTKGYAPEAGLGKYKHVVEADPATIYNAWEDPLGLRAQLDAELTSPERTTQFERLVRDAGFKGLYYSESELGQVVLMFDKTKPARVIDDRFDLPLDEIATKEDIAKLGKKFFQSKGGWAILTGTQERLGPADSELNVKQNEKLRKELTRRGVEFEEVGGSYQGVDQGSSFLVFMPEREALDLAQRYKQESILTRKGLEYGDGRLVPAVPEETVVGPEAKELDFYSSLPDGTAFSVGLDFGGMVEPDTFARVGDPLSPEAQQELVNKVPGLKHVLPNLTAEEQARVRATNAQKIVDMVEKLPSAEEMAAVAFSGRAKRGWYRRSAQALVDIFGIEDAPRFSALLAALSPQTSVETNTKNALNIWAAWKRAGRPTDAKGVKRAISAGLMGGKVLPAWVNNSVEALTNPDVNAIRLSGPKVSSFMLNLNDVTHEVTNDAWMTNYAGVSENFVKGQSKKKPGGGTFTEKSLGYIAMSSVVRRAAEVASDMTGEKWTPSEIQETVWSWAKTLYETAYSRNDQKFSAATANKRLNGVTAEQVLAAGGLTAEDISSTPDFATLFVSGVYRNILERGGYDLSRLDGSDKQHDGRGAGGRDPLSTEGTRFDRGSFEQHLRRAAQRLDALSAARQTEAGLAGPTQEEEEVAPSYSDEDIDDFLASVAPAAEDLKPLPGLTTSKGPIASVVRAARAYAASRGIPIRRQSEYVKVDVERAKRIAKAYDEMKHAPDDPAVKAAYQAMIDETLAQYQFVKATGLVIEAIEPGQADPYTGGPKEVLEDLERGHLWFYPTESGFGSSDADTSGNPLLAPTNEKIGDRVLLANDVFRIVHDFFGHGIEGSGFGARGEENAWQSHMRLYSEAALPAVTSETRGQNSWVNYGPFGEQNRANQRETVYADQKTGIMPEWTWREGVADDGRNQLPEWVTDDDIDAFATVGVPVRTDSLPLFPELDEQSFDRWFDGSVVTHEDGTPAVVYHGTPRPGFEEFDPNQKGVTTVLFSSIETHRNGFFFAENVDFAKTFAEQSRTGEVMPVFLSIKNPFDARESTNKTIDIFEKRVWPRMVEIDPSLNYPDFIADRIGHHDFWETLDTVEGGDVFVQALKDTGFDGIRMFEPSHDTRNSENVWVAFDNTQIKSALRNTGAYNPDRGNIYAMSGTSAARGPYKAEQSRPDQGIPTPAGQQAGGEKMDLSLNRITQNLAKIMDLTLRQGRISMTARDSFGNKQEVMGEYNRRQDVARVRSKSDLSTAVHEAGHALYFGANDPLKRFITGNDTKLMKAAKDLYGGDTNIMPKSTQVAEGFAEFFRVYVLNKRYAQRVYPELTQQFDDLLTTHDKKLKDGLEIIAQQYMAYLQLPSAQVISNMIVSGRRDGAIDTAMKELREVGFKTWFHEYARGVVEHTVNRFAPLDDLVTQINNIANKNTGKALDLKRADDPRALIRLAQNFGARAHIQLTDGVMGYRSVNPETRSLRDALLLSQGRRTDQNLSRIDPVRQQDFATYLVALRLVDEFRRLDEGKIERPPVDDATLGDAKLTIDEMNAKYKEFAEAAKIVHEYSMGLWKKAYDAGLMTKETYQDGLDRQFYAPLQRDMSDKRANYGEGPLTGGQRFVKRFRGSGRDIIDPMDILMHKTYALEQIIARNDVMKTLASLADRAGKAGALVERVPSTKMIGTQLSVRDAARQLLNDENITEADAADLMLILEATIKDDKQLVAFRASQASAMGDNTVFFWENGKLAALQLADGDLGADIVNVVNGLGRENLPLFADLIAGTSTAFRSAITLWPDFLFVNFIRDQMSAFILTRGYKPFWTGLKGVGDELRQRQWAKHYNAAMGMMGGMNVASLHEARVTRDINALRKQGYIANVFRADGVLDGIRNVARLAELTETGSRLGIFRTSYERAKADGLNDWEASIEASYEAVDYMNFGLNGSRMLLFRRTIPFLNAQLQGLYKMMRTLGADEVRQRKGIRFVLSSYFKSINGLDLSRTEKQALSKGRAAWVKMASLGLISALLHFLFEDDPDYQEASEYLRTTGWVIPLGEGRLAYIPKPFELAVLANFTERAFEAASGDSTALKERFLRGFAMTMTPPTAPPILQSLVEYAANKDFFSGREIVPSYMQALSPELQFNNYTTAFAKQVGEITGWSPMVIDHFMSSLGASAYRDLTNVYNALDPARPTMDMTDAPLTRRFVRDVRRGSTSSQDFWKQASTLNGTLRTAEVTYRNYLEAGNEQAANAFLDTLDEDARAYALLNAHFKVEYKRLNPFYRTRQINTIVSAMRRELVTDLGLDDTTVKGSRDTIKLSRKEKAEIDTALSEYARREMRNTLIAMREPGWYGKRPLRTDTTINLIEAIDPRVRDELERRIAKAKVYSADAVYEYWPEVQNRLISDRENAFLGDVLAIAKAVR